MNYKEPEFDGKVFNCPHCNGYAHQLWKHYSFVNIKNEVHLEESRKNEREIGNKIYGGLKDLSISHCLLCEDYAIWANQKLLYPDKTVAPVPNIDMPASVMQYYNEARMVLRSSPRAAAALLRLSIEILCKEHLKTKGNKLDYYISKLYKDIKVDEKTKNALDVIRSIGNKSIHEPSRIHIDDDHNIAILLFNVVNYIIQNTISAEKEIDYMYGLISDGELDHIKERDR